MTTHWLPQDPNQSPIAACGLDVDRLGLSWSRYRMAHGKLPSCPKCRTEAIVRPGNALIDRIDEAITRGTGATYAEVGEP